MQGSWLVRLRPLSQRLVAPVILLVLVSGINWKLLTKQYTWLDQPDAANQVLPWLQFQADSWHKGEFPTWDPRVYGGQPVLGQLQPGGAYPLNWPLFWLPLDHGYISYYFLNLYYVFTHFLAALFSYWLCRDAGRSRAASVIGGLAFAVSGEVGVLGWPQMLNGAIWAPLVLLFLLRMLRDYRPVASAGFAGVFLGVAFLSGHHQIPTFMALMAGSLLLVRLWERNLLAIRELAAFGIFAGLVSALQVLPAIEAGKLSLRWVGAAEPVGWTNKVPYIVHDRYSLLPLSLVGIVLRNVTTREVYMGLAVVALAVAGISVFLRLREVRIAMAVCIGGMLIGLGGFTVFHGIAYLLVPMVEKARSPQMAIVLANLAIAFLAAFGVDAMRSGSIGLGWRRWLTGLGAGALILASAVASFRNEAGREYEHIVVFGISALALALIMKGWESLGERTALCAVLIVAMFEWGSSTGVAFHHKEQPAGFLAPLALNRDIAEFLKSRPDLGRENVNQDDVPYNFGDWEGIDQYRGSLGSLTSNVTRSVGDIFANNYYIGKNPENPSEQEVFRGRSGLRVFYNPAAVPFVRAIHGKSPCSAPDDVRLTVRKNKLFAASAKLGCPGTVVFSEVYFPGWIALVDGKQRPLREVLGTMQGVDVGTGEHIVEIVYRPWSIYLGAWLTALGLAGALVMAWAMRRPAFQLPWNKLASETKPPSL